MNRNIEIKVVRLDVPVDQVRAFADVLSEDECKRADRFVFEVDRRRFIVARARLRQLLGVKLKIRPEAVELTYGKHGKPALKAGDLRFNVSHCDELAVYAFAHGREIGVDVEAIRWMLDANDVASRCFSSRENRAYRALDPAIRPNGFFNCWTRKEAFIKAVGDGFSHPLDDFDVSLTPGKPARILRVANTPGDRCGWSIASFTPLPGFTAAVVAEKSPSLRS